MLRDAGPERGARPVSSAWGRKAMYDLSGQLRACYSFVARAVPGPDLDCLRDELVRADLVCLGDNRHHLARFNFCPAGRHSSTTCPRPLLRTSYRLELRLDHQVCHRSDRSLHPPHIDRTDVGGTVDRASLLGKPHQFALRVDNRNIYYCTAYNTTFCVQERRCLSSARRACWRQF